MSFIGIPLKDGVIKQLNKRADIISKENKNDKEIRYLTGKSAWVRMISGVDTEEGSKLAQSFVLSGGELKWNSNSKTFNKTTGISFESSNTRKKYNYDEQLGIRPQAGLTSFKIASKNRFGSIRQADLSFNVWTREDLDLVQTLFLRPGFPCIVEWGHSVYCSNNGVIENFIDDYDYNELFNKKDFRKVNFILQEKKKKYDYNYDNFIGLITNFNWSYRQDGGYDCSITVVTYGTLLSSLTVKKSSNLIEPSEQNNEKTILHSFLSRLNLDQFNNKTLLDFLNDDEIRNGTYNVRVLNTKAFEADFRGGVSYNIKQFPIITDSLYSNLISQLNIKTNKNTNILKILKFKINNYVFKRDDFVNYLSLRQFLALCNISFDIQGINKDQAVGSSFSLEEGNKYATFDNHFSIDPIVAILPKYTTQDELKGRIGLYGKTKSFKDTFDESKVFDNDDILEIRVSSIIILSKIDSQIDAKSSPSNINVLDLVKSVLSEIEDALGGINEFDVAYNENTNKYEVVDRKINPFIKNNKDVNKNIPVLDYTGKRSLFNELNLSSKISSELASMISISAGAEDTTQLNTDQALIDWNEGLTSRFPFKNEIIEDIPSRQERNSTLPILQENEVEKRNIYINNLIKAYNKFNNSEYDEELFKKIKVESIERIRNAFYYHSKNRGIIPGLIPIELSFSMDGIGGFDIGEVFTLVKKGERSVLLPSKYDNYGFIITGLDHSIDTNGKWITNVTGTTFKLYTEPDTTIEVQNKAGII